MGEEALILNAVTWEMFISCSNPLMLYTLLLLPSVLPVTPTPIGSLLKNHTQETKIYHHSAVGVATCSMSAVTMSMSV